MSYCIYSKHFAVNLCEKRSIETVHFDGTNSRANLKKTKFILVDYLVNSNDIPTVHPSYREHKTPFSQKITKVVNVQD